jgi:hypothetical protein
VHALGYSDRAAKTSKEEDRITKYGYTHDEPHRHWKPNVEGGVTQSYSYTLNLDSFVAEVTVGAYEFFTQLETQEATDPTHVKAYLMNAEKIVYVSGAPPKHFADINGLYPPTRETLAYLDTGHPDVVTLRSKIREIYPPEDRKPKQYPDTCAAPHQVWKAGSTSGEA